MLLVVYKLAPSVLFHACEKEIGREAERKREKEMAGYYKRRAKKYRRNLAAGSK